MYFKKIKGDMYEIFLIIFEYCEIIFVICSMLFFFFDIYFLLMIFICLLFLIINFKLVKYWNFVMYVLLIVLGWYGEYLYFNIFLFDKNK